MNLFSINNIKRISFRNDINALRAIAVMVVVFYHADIETFRGGWLGVDIFFVISGYLISNIIISEFNEGAFSFKRFYLRRIRRILPALFSTLFLTIPLSFFYLQGNELEEYFSSALASLFFYANYYFMNLDFYVAESTKLMPLLHTWSLAVEEQYYLLFPVVIYLLFNYFKKIFFLSISLIAALSIYLNISSQELEVFYKLEYRIWEFLLGTIVMIISSNIRIKNLEIIGLPIMIVPILYFDDSQILYILPVLLALTGTSLVLISDSNSSEISKFSNLKIISLIGLSSYSIYLFHQPIFSFYRIYKSSLWENHLSNNTELTFINIIALIFLTVIFGIVNYFIIEKRFLNLNNYKIIFSLFLLVIFSLALLFGYNSNNQSQISYVEKISNLELNSFSLNGKICHNREINDLCSINNSSDLSVYALGDSSLQSTSYWLAQNSKEYDFNFTSVTYSACIFLFEKRVSDDSCSDINYLELENYVGSIQNSVIIYGARYPMYFNKQAFNNSIVLEQNFYHLEVNLDLSKEIKKTIDKLIEQNNTIILIYPIPEQGWNVPKLFNFPEFTKIGTVSYPIDAWEKRRKLSYQALNKIANNNIISIYPEEIFCNSFVRGECVGAFDKQIYYSDTNHLSLDGAKLISDLILVKIKLLNSGS